MRGYSVRRKKYKNGSGDYVESSKYHCFFRDHLGKQRSISIGSEAIAYRFGEQVVFLVESRKFNERPNLITSNWIRTLPPQILEKLSSMDLIEGAQVSYLPLSQAKVKYHEYRSDKIGESALLEQKNNLDKFLDWSSATYWSQVTATQVKEYLDFISEEVQPNGSKYSSSTISKRMAVVLGFGNFMDPSVNLGKGLVIKQTRSTHNKRPLTEDEVSGLMTYLASDRASVLGGVRPSLRMLLYQTALLTGLRLKELRSLTVNNLDTQNSMLILSGKQTKNKKEFRIHLPSYMVDALLKSSNQGKLFKMPKDWRAAQFIREDMYDAGFDMSGVSGSEVYFHSLRYTFITRLNLLPIGEHMKLTMGRHSKMSTNMGYTKFSEQDMCKSWTQFREAYSNSGVAN